MPKKMISKKPAVKKKESYFLVSTIWKNQSKFDGRDYWTLVLEDGSRVRCYDPNALKNYVDLNEKVTNFDPPIKISVPVSSGKTQKPWQNKQADNSNPIEKKTWGKSQEEIENIRKQVALYAAINFAEYQPSKRRGLKDVESYYKFFLELLMG